jgi:hypothetical protein
MQKKIYFFWLGHMILAKKVKTHFLIGKRKSPFFLKLALTSNSLTNSLSVHPFVE